MNTPQPKSLGRGTPVPDLPTTVARAYAERPETVMAIQWDGSNTDAVEKLLKAAGANYVVFGGGMAIETPEGPAEAHLGNYIVATADGVCYPLASDVFARSYIPTP